MGLTALISYCHCLLHFERYIEHKNMWLACHWASNFHFSTAWCHLFISGFGEKYVQWKKTVHLQCDILVQIRICLSAVTITVTYRLNRRYTFFTSSQSLSIFFFSFFFWWFDGSQIRACCKTDMKPIVPWKPPSKKDDSRPRLGGHSCCPQNWETCWEILGVGEQNKQTNKTP